MTGLLIWQFPVYIHLQYQDTNDYLHSHSLPKIGQISVTARLRNNLYLTVAEYLKYPKRNNGAVCEMKICMGFQNRAWGKVRYSKRLFIIDELISLKQNRKIPMIIERNASLSIISIKKYVVQLWSLLLTWQTYVANCAWVLYVLINHQWCKITGLYQHLISNPFIGLRRDVALGSLQHHCIRFIVANIKTAVNYSSTISVPHLIISVLHYYFPLLLALQHQSWPQWSVNTMPALHSAQE